MRESHLAESIQTSTSTILVTHEPIGWWQGAAGKGGNRNRGSLSTEQVILSTGLLNLPKVTLWWVTTWDKIYSHFSPNPRGLHIYLFPDLLCYPLSIILLPSPWTCRQIISHSNESRYTHTFTISYSKQIEQQGVLEILSTGRISLPHCFSGMSPKWFVVLKLYILGWCLQIVQKHL